MKKLLTILFVALTTLAYSQAPGTDKWYVDYEALAGDSKYEALWAHYKATGLKFFSGTVTAPPWNNSPAIASTAYVDRAVSMGAVRMVTLSQAVGSGHTSIAFPHGLTGLDYTYNVVATARSYHYEDVRYVSVDATYFYVHLMSPSTSGTFIYSFAYSPTGFIYE